MKDQLLKLLREKGFKKGEFITTGGSTIRAAQSLKEAGYRVAAVVVVVDRQEGGREAIEKELRVPVRSILRRKDFIPEK
jgi:orotate phosphoribosyltransferase